MVDGNVLCHGEHEGSLTHGRTCRDNHQVGVLPARGHLVELMEAAGQSTQTVRTCSRLLQHVVRLLDDRIDLRIILFHVLLGDLKEFPFSFLHEVVHILGGIKRFRLYIAGKCNQLTSQEFLCNDAGMIFNVRRGGNLTTQLRDIEGTSYIIQLPGLLQLFGHCQNINRLLLDGKCADGLVDELVPLVIERLGT